MRIAGIDPGANGAIAVLDSENPDSVALLDLQKVSIYKTTEWLHNQKVSAVWLENVHSLFGMSAKSNFRFGRNFGIALAIAKIGTSDVPIHQVTPNIWQQAVGVTVKGKPIKKQVASIAQDKYPTASLYGPRGGLLDGRSDALMIAHYGLNHKEEA